MTPSLRRFIAGAAIGLTLVAVLASPSPDAADAASAGRDLLSFALTSRTPDAAAAG
jgi:hypothetical protein